MNVRRIQYRVKLAIRRYKIRGIRLLKRIHIPGGEGVRLYDVLRMLQRVFQGENFDLRAFAMAFNFFLAFFPTVIFVFLVLPYLPVQNAEDKVIAWLESVLPGDSVGLLTSAIAMSDQHSNAGLISISVITVLFFANRGVRFMMKAFKKTDPEGFKKRSVVREYIVAFGIYFGLLGIGVLGLAVYQVAEWLIQLIQSHPNEATLFEIAFIKLARTILTLIIIFSALSFVYRVAPNVERKIRIVSSGGIVATLLMYLAEIGLQIYFSNFARYNQMYGSLTAVMVLLIWFYWMSVVLLLGYEVNVAIRRAQHLYGGIRSGPKRHYSSVITDAAIPQGIWQAGSGSSEAKPDEETAV